MTCQELVDFLMAYLDGELPDEQRRIFDDHLGLCPPCVAYMDSYREAVSLGKAVCKADCDELPDDVPESLVEAILRSRA